jgi:nicotinamidase-related amidase
MDRMSNEGHSFADELEALRAQFEASGLANRFGFGERPALVVVDMIVGFTSAESPLGADVPDTVEAIARLLDAARASGTPVFYSTCIWRPEPEQGLVWSEKIPSQRALEPGSKWVEVDERLEPEAGEPVLEKHYPSCFFGTDLAERLRAAGVDTVIVTGMTTSGCVRASAVDSTSSGFRTIVPREAVADRAELPHLASLFDMDAKYADVMSLQEVLEQLAARARQEARS